jgi:hypothetical protein
MLLFMEDASSHTDEYILKYKLEALKKFKKWKGPEKKNRASK